MASFTHIASAAIVGTTIMIVLVVATRPQNLSVLKSNAAAGIGAIILFVTAVGLFAIELAKGVGAMR